jgi:O-antigen/teichoic acid export membrane protein
MIRGIFARNVGLSTVLKLSAFVLQFAVLPVLVRALGTQEYGVWVAMQSLVVWVSLLELGLSKGLRNRLIESLGDGKHELARSYISSCFFGQLLLWSGVCSVLYLVLMFGGFPWARWMKSQGDDYQIASGLFLSFVSFSLMQLFGVANAILYAKHWNAATALVGFFSSIGLFLYAYLSDRYGLHVSIPKLAFVNLVLFGSGYAIQSLYLAGAFPELIPTWRLFRWSQFEDVIRSGSRFLLIEITYIVIFVMDRWIVLQILGPGAVTQYDILLRLSSLVTTGYTLFIGPTWALSGTAWAKQDSEMMSKLWRIVSGLMIPFATVAVAIGFLMNPLIHLWIDPAIHLEPIARASMVLYSWVVIWSAGYASLLNGIGRVREQMICSVLACLLNIPLSIYLCQIQGVGIAGVLIASTLSLSMFSLVAPFVWRDCHRICKGIS